MKLYMTNAHLCRGVSQRDKMWWKERLIWFVQCVMQGHVTPLIITHITRTPQQAVDSMTPALKNAGITTASQVSKLFSEETWVVTSKLFFVEDYHFITLMTLQINRSMLIHYIHSIPQTVAVCPLKGMRNIVKCTSGIMTCPLSCSSHICVITLLLPLTQCFT